MERTKAEFKAIRELVGLSQLGLAERLGVQGRSVRRWESPNAPQEAPEYAWQLIGELRNRQLMAVGQAAEELDGLIADGEEVQTIELPFYFAQDDYDDPDDGDFRMANANVRLIMHEAERRGIIVKLVFA